MWVAVPLSVVLAVVPGLVFEHPAADSVAAAIPAVTARMIRRFGFIAGPMAVVRVVNWGYGAEVTGWTWNLQK